MVQELDQAKNATPEAERPEPGEAFYQLPYVLSRDFHIYSVFRMKRLAGIATSASRASKFNQPYRLSMLLSDKLLNPLPFFL